MDSLKELREWFLVDPENRRNKTKTGRLSLEERDEIATAFWDDLLQRYTSGDVPEA